MSETRIGPNGTPYQHHWLETGDGSDGVVVYCESPHGVLFARQYRTSGRGWELPRGFGERRSGGARQDGVREFREETGLELVRAEVCGRFVVDSSVLPTWISVIRGAVTDIEPSEAPDGELSATRWIPHQEIGALVRSGEIDDAISLSAIATVSASERGAGRARGSVGAR